MERIVDVSTDDVHLAVTRGFMTVSQQRAELGRVPLDDSAAVIVHSHGVTWTTNLAVRLAERGATMVLCAGNHAPAAMMVPLQGHHAQNLRVRAQLEATQPFVKQAWKSIVTARLRMQGSLLIALGHIEGQGLRAIAARVRLHYSSALLQLYGITTSHLSSSIQHFSG